MSDGGSKLSWIAELRRRKVFRVAAVYLVAAWLAIQVADATFEPMGLPGWTLKLVITLAALGFPLACGLAWAFDVTPRGIERTPPAGPLPAVPSSMPPAGPGADSGPGAAPPAPAESVAILPFADMSPARDQEYFCDGIAEEIINSLCCIRDLRIASRTSSFQFKHRSADVREIGRVLGVGAVLEGSVRKAGERVRVTAQLVSTTDGYHLWSESFDRELSDVFAIQTEIAQKLVQALRVTLSRQERQLIERRGTSNAEAYDLYLRGQHFLRDGTDITLPRAVEMFRQAIARDGRFAQAHAGLANAQAIKGLWRIGMTEEDFEEAFAASRRALELEPRMPEAVIARACLLSMQHRNEEAERAFQEALRLNPASFDAYYLFGRHCFGSGAFEQALPLFEAAVQLRADDFQALSMLCGTLERLGRSEQMREISARTMQAIEARLSADPDDSRALQLGTVQAAKLGDFARSRELGEHLLRLRPDSFASLYNAACAWTVMADRDRALELIDRAVMHGRGNLGWIEHDPDLDSLRGDPRFEAIVDRLRVTSGAAS
jgi:TolB-like protein/cytochrome c-type biogenesis protein CcmH/NrfG